MNADIPARLAAQAVAMRAMVNDLDQMAVDDMRALAEELMHRDDPLTRAIMGFATQYPLARYDAGALAMQGRILRDALLVAVGAVPHLAQRGDVDG